MEQGPESPSRRFAGIDEAGYGPNLGPLVMTAVVAERDGGGEDVPAPDLWADLSATVSRAGGPSDRLWVDDSKRVYGSGKGFDRLEAASLAVLDAVGLPLPTDFPGLLAALGAGSLADVELDLWLDPEAPPPPVPRPDFQPRVAATLAARPFAGAPWRLVAVYALVVGPARFNADLDATGNKSSAHFATFAHLLGGLWSDTPDGVPLSVRADKHGGRHFYQAPLTSAFPDCWIDRGPEGPSLSRYTLRTPSRRLTLSLTPRADADDGLVALASLISKHLREVWMSAFNAHWRSLLPGLPPTAGYPVDASRFRASIEPLCHARGLELRRWWRSR